MITIIPPEKGKKHPLLFQRFGELPLPAYMQLDMERRLVTFGYWEWNTEPKVVTVGFELWRRLNCRTSRRAATKLAKELEPLLERVCDGYSVEYDGRNHFGYLSPDAEEAAEEMTARLKKLYFRE